MNGSPTSSSGILALMENPGQQAGLAADPSLVPVAIEEMLRYTSPVTAFVRTATRDTELRGIPVKPGDRAAMFYPSANRDESRFDDPDRFDIGRAPNPRLAFGGGGTHFCLGANLARVEATAIISRSADAAEGPRACGTGRAGAVEFDERHPLDAGPVYGPLCQRKLLTYLPISRASARLTPDG